jgi:hypothetical protein
LKNKIIPIILVILLSSTALYLTTNLSANAAVGQGEWIKYYKIEDATTGNLILEKNFETGATSGNGQISEGQDLKVTFEIGIGTSNPSSSLTLSTSLARLQSKDHYWEHDASDGYSLGNNYNPNSPSFSFPQNSGTLKMTVYGKATGTVASTVNGVTLHKAVPVVLVSLKDPSNTVLDEIKKDITDASINAYNTKLAEQQSKVAGYASSGVSPATIEAFNNIIAESQTLAAAGLTDNALGMLKALDTSASPASATMEILFIPLIVVFAIIAVIFAVMFMRNRGKVGYYKLVVEDQIKDLEGLTIRANKIDKTMGASLESVKDRLKRLVGM